MAIPLLANLLEKEKLIPQADFTEFCKLKTRKGKAPLTSPFDCRMLVRQHQKESDLMSDMHGGTTWNALKTLVTMLQTFKIENMVVVAHDNGKNNNIFEKRQLLLMHSPGSGCLSP